MRYRTTNAENIFRFIGFSEVRNHANFLFEAVYGNQFVLQGRNFIGELLDLLALILDFVQMIVKLVGYFEFPLLDYRRCSFQVIIIVDDIPKTNHKGKKENSETSY